MSKAIPIAEVFGPTIQGEGPDAGLPCLFIRTGGCDFRCSWCDSDLAVLPKFVRELPRLTVEEIVEQVRALAEPPITVVLSGGNPVIHDLSDLVGWLSDIGYRVVVETQGSRWKDWLLSVDLVVVSPKPPSSKMETDWTKLATVVENLHPAPVGEPDRIALKVVVGDEADYAYAKQVHRAFPRVPFFVSVLNPAGSDAAKFDERDVLDGFTWLADRVKDDPEMRHVKVLPQLHTLAWGAQTGV